MKNLSTGIIVIVILAALLGVLIYVQKDVTPENSSIPTQTQDEQDVRSIVTEFGTKLQLVPLSATKPIAAKAIHDNYAPYVSADILAFWEKDPAQAPGRLTSSPWPQRIEITSVTKNEDGSYDVQGKIIEVTSVELANGGAAAELPIALKLRKQDNKWVITGISAATPHI